MAVQRGKWARTAKRQSDGLFVERLDLTPWRRYLAAFTSYQLAKARGDGAAIREAKRQMAMEVIWLLAADVDIEQAFRASASDSDRS